MNDFTQTVGNGLWRLRFGGKALLLCLLILWRDQYQESPHDWLPKEIDEIYGSVVRFQSGLPVRGYALVGVKE